MKKSRTPLYTALKEYTEKPVVHFDVPGHKKVFSLIEGDAFWDAVVRYDANSTKDLDNLSSPYGVIMEAEDLIASAYKADKAYMLVNGSTFGVQAMIMSVLNPLDKILLPRNIHKSVINGIILSGALPVFIEPFIDHEYGISNGLTYDSVKKALKENPDIKALLMIHPTYFGIVSDLASIIKLCHRNKVLVLVDEAHGAHFPFHDRFPFNASALGADLVTASVHKTCGSLTQSSILLANDKNVDLSRVRTTINLMQTTSASYLLMASLDLARQKLVSEGESRFGEILNALDEARMVLNSTSGLSVITKDYLNGSSVYDIDETKLVVRVNGLGLTGFEVYDILLEKYLIQVELAETYVVLAVVGIGDTRDSIFKLVEALQDISRKYFGKKPPLSFSIGDFFKKPSTVVSPRDAFYSPKKMMDIEHSIGEISGESIMIYPPGIPLIIPGERISREVVDHYRFYKDQSCIIMNTSGTDDILVLGEE
ncbi:MAG: aminotransferase class V-fold PLP-dependent enzyme [Clostridia bacterium]